MPSTNGASAAGPTQPRRHFLAKVGLLSVPAVGLFAERAGAQTPPPITDDDLLAAVEQVRAGVLATGGGTLRTREGVDQLEVSWDGSFVIGPGGRGPQFSDTMGGYLVTMPTSGSIPVVGSSTPRPIVVDDDVAWVALSIEALFYILPVPGSPDRPSGYGTAGDPPGVASVPENFRIVPLDTNPLEMPSNWIRVVGVDLFSGAATFANGVIVKIGSSWTGGDGMASSTALAELGTEVDDLATQVEALAGGTELPAFGTDVRAFGAVPGRTVTCTVSGSTVTIDHASGADPLLTEDHVDALVAIRGVGETIDGVDVDFWTTFSAVGTDGFTATLAATPPHGGSGKRLDYSQAAQEGIRDAIVAIAAAGGGTVVLPPGTYCLGGPIEIAHTDRVRLTGPGATIRYHSAGSWFDDDDPDTALNKPAAMNARTALILRGRCHDWTIEELTFEGDYGDPRNRANFGIAIATFGLDGGHTQGLAVHRVRSHFGGGLLVEGMDNGQPDHADNARGTRVTDCTIYGARLNLVPSTHAVISGCHFELPMDPSFDDYLHSSHAIYAYAGRAAIVVTGNTFRNVRRWALKAAGSLVPVRSVMFTGNSLWRCGGGAQVVGRDGQENSSVVVTSNSFVNCTVGATGSWNEQAVVDLDGVKNGVISANSFFWTESSGPGAVRAVQVSAVAHSTPVEGVVVEGNVFQALLTGGLGPADFMGAAIFVSGAGNYVLPFEGAYPSADAGGTQVGVRVAGNTIKSCCGVGISASDAAHLVIEGNQIGNCLPMQLDGCALPVVRQNVHLGGTSGTAYAGIRIQDCSWPLIYDNHGTGPVLRPDGYPSIVYGRGLPTDDNGTGRNPVDFPLLGRRGRAVPTDGYAEVVMAYGSPAKVNTEGDVYAGGWRDGDTVSINGTILTHKAVSPGYREFNDVATFITAVGTVGGYTASDYGDPFGVETRHVKIRRTIRGDQGWPVEVRAVHPCAGRVLPNGTNENFAMAWAQGGNRGDTVVWSPLCEYGSVPNVVAANAEARDLLRDNGYYRRDSTDRAAYGGSLVVDHGQPAEGVPEELRWAIG